MSTNSWDPAAPDASQLATRVLNSQPTVWLSNSLGGVDLLTACPAKSVSFANSGSYTLPATTNRSVIQLGNFRVSRAGLYLITIPNVQVGFVFSNGVANVLNVVLVLNAGGQIYATSNNQLYNDPGLPDVFTSANGSLLMMVYLNTGTTYNLTMEVSQQNLGTSLATTVAYQATLIQPLSFGSDTLGSSVYVLSAS